MGILELFIAENLIYCILYNKKFVNLGRRFIYESVLWKSNFDRTRHTWYSS